MPRKTDARRTVHLRSTAGTGTTYTTTKNARTTPQRLELRKFDRRSRRHELFREAR